MGGRKACRLLAVAAACFTARTDAFAFSRAPSMLSSPPGARTFIAPTHAPGLSFARGIRSPATAAPLLRQGDEQQGRGDGVALQQWRGSGLFDVSNHFEYGLLLNGVLAALLFFSGKYKSSLTKAGLFNAFLLGVMLYTPLGWPGWSTAATYFVLGSAVTKIKMAEKEKAGIAEARGGARGPENVWGSAGSAAWCALMATYSPYSSGIFKVGFVAAFATKLSDTFASEVGKAYGKNTYLITTFAKVPPGTEGAVSVEGTVAGVGGSLLMVGWGLWQGLINPLGAILCVVAALVATTAESYIGAALQNNYDWMTNEVVNAINTAIGVSVAMLTYALLGGV